VEGGFRQEAGGERRGREWEWATPKTFYPGNCGANREGCKREADLRRAAKALAGFY